LERLAVVYFAELRSQPVRRYRSEMAVLINNQPAMLGVAKDVRLFQNRLKYRCRPAMNS
jgi:hypothetical protein